MLLQVASLLLLAPGPLAGEELALVGGTVYTSPEAEPLEHGVVLIRDGRVAAVGGPELAVPEDAVAIDCAGRAVTAGFWNAHVHLFERKWADAAALPAKELEEELRQAFLRFGFTSVFDLGSEWANTSALRARVEAGEVAGPRILTTGEPLIAPGAMPSARILAILGHTSFPVPEVRDPDEARAAVERLVELGVDALKLHLQPPPASGQRLSEETIRAAVTAAHRAGKLVFVHPSDGRDVQVALRAGADVIAHTTPLAGAWEALQLPSLATWPVALVPTLTLWDDFSRHDGLRERERVSRNALDQLRAWRAAGGLVLFGTDQGAVGPDPTREYVALQEAGLGLREILAALTTAPGGRFGRAGGLGLVAPGLPADLVVLEEDPARDLLVLARVRLTLRAGRILYDAGS